MRVLVVHNAYQQRGGEDAVVESEIELLRANGHEVTEYLRDNHELASMGRLSAAAGTLWSRRTVDEVGRQIARDRPDVLHAHNTFPLISPSLYWAAERAGVPVVQTLHNFRLLCPQAMLLREEKACELCVGKSPLSGVRHACYRGSRPQTAVLAGMLMLHRAIGTWSHKVARYIALNEFCRAKFIEGGLPASRIVVKPNFVDFDAPAEVPRDGFLFVGRLAPEKGVGVLARATKALPECDFSIAGIGPEAETLANLPNVRMLGSLSADSVRYRMSSALALVLPSIWYENFPRTLVEAYACGLPVIASRIGALAELVEDGVTGLLFEPGDNGDLVQKLRWARANRERMITMGFNARAHFEAQFSAKRNHEQLVAI